MTTRSPNWVASGAAYQVNMCEGRQDDMRNIPNLLMAAKPSTRKAREMRRRGFVRLNVKTSIRSKDPEVMTGQDVHGIYSKKSDYEPIVS